MRAALVLFVVLLPAAAAQSPVAAREGYVDAGNGVRLFYRSVGRGPDTLVVLHGGPGFSMSYFARDLEPLAARHVLLFYDQRGAGRSTLVTDSTALDAQRFAEDLEAVRRAFKIEKLNLFGHSWGGAVAALYATRYPAHVGRLLLLGSLPATRTQFREAFANLNGRRDSTGLRQLEERRAVRLANPGDARACRAYYESWFSVAFDDPNVMRRTRGDFCAGTPEALTNKVKSVDRYTTTSLGDWDWRPGLRAVSAPALVILGARDFMSAASGRDWAAALSNGRYLQIEGGGHFLYLEQPDRFFGAVDAFLAGRWPDGAVAIPPTPIDWSAEDSGRMAAIKARPQRHERPGVIVWAPADSLDARWLGAFTDTLASSLAVLRARIGAHPWQRIGTRPVEYFLSPGRFVSHASGEGSVFISLTRVRQGAPFLHEATHELLFPQGPYFPEDFPDTVVAARVRAERPLWLIEGLPDYLAQSTAAATGFNEGDVFAIGGLAKVDSACAARLAASPRRAEIVEKVGGQGALEALFTTERAEVAPVFYACSQSFTKELVERIGLERVIALFPAIPAGTWQRDLEAAAGMSLDGVRRRWLQRIAP